MKLVLIRHGESAWNLENRFTGWKDVDLSPKGIEEAKAAGKILKEMNLVFDVAYTSYLKRAIKTLNNLIQFNLWKQKSVIPMRNSRSSAR